MHIDDDVVLDELKHSLSSSYSMSTCTDVIGNIHVRLCSNCYVVV